MREGEYTDHAGRRVQFTDGQTVQLVADLYQFVEQEYKGSKSVDAARLESVLRDLQAGKPLDTDGWNVLSDLRRRYGKQFEQWRKDGRQGQDPKMPGGSGRVSEALAYSAPSVLAHLREATVSTPSQYNAMNVADSRHPLIHKPTLCIDFDGVIHQGGHGMPGEVGGTVVPGTPQALRKLSDRYKLVILTARQDFGSVRDWLKKNGLSDYVDEVTNVKPQALGYIDDRAIHFNGDWKTAMDAADPGKATQQAIVVKKTHESKRPVLRIVAEGDTPSTTKQDKDSTAPHLHDTILHDLAHTMRHIKRIMEPDARGSEQSTQFNAEHALHHAESAQEHAKKLDAHLSENPSNPKTWKSERDMLQQMREIGDYPLGTILDHR